MDISLLTVVYSILPCLIAGYAAVVYLASRFIPPRAAWLAAFAMAGLFVAGATIAMQRAVQGLAPTGSLIKAYVALYVIPTMVLTAAALSLRSRLSSRWLGTLILLTLAVIVLPASGYASGFFFDLVNASG